MHRNVLLSEMALNFVPLILSLMSSFDHRTKNKLRTLEKEGCVS